MSYSWGRTIPSDLIPCLAGLYNVTCKIVDKEYLFPIGLSASLASLSEICPFGVLICLLGFFAIQLHCPFRVGLFRCPSHSVNADGVVDICKTMGRYYVPRLT